MPGDGGGIWETIEGAIGRARKMGEGNDREYGAEEKTGEALKGGM